MVGLCMVARPAARRHLITTPPACPGRSIRVARLAAQTNASTAPAGKQSDRGAQTKEAYVTTQTATRVNGKAVRYALTAPLRKQLVGNHMDVDGALSRARQLIHRPETRRRPTASSSSSSSPCA